MEYRKYPSRKLRHYLSIPFVLMTMIPLAILDIFGELYQHVCFPLWKIPIFRRKDYIRIDRYKLRYLNLGEKMGCFYCSYANGLMNYAMAIAGRTEIYWCSIRHKKYEGFVEPLHHKIFLKYGDEKAFRKKYG